MSAARALALAAALGLALTCAAQAAGEKGGRAVLLGSRHRLEKPDLSGLRANSLCHRGRLSALSTSRSPTASSWALTSIWRARFAKSWSWPARSSAAAWDLLIPALGDNSADAIVAALAMNAENRALVDFTGPYFIMPGRFATRAELGAWPRDAEVLKDRLVAVVAGSTHEAYLKTFFPKAQLVSFENAALARLALKNGRVNALFGDAVSLSFWLNGVEAEGCCVFSNGAYVDVKFFGEGLGVAVKKGATPLRRALDYALARLAQRGTLRRTLFQIFSDQPVLKSFRAEPETGWRQDKLRSHTSLCSIAMRDQLQRGAGGGLRSSARGNWRLSCPRGAWRLRSRRRRGLDPRPASAKSPIRAGLTHRADFSRRCRPRLG